MPNTSDPRTRPSPLTDAQYADLLQIRANLPARSLGAVRGLLQLGLVEKSTPRGQPYALTFKGAALLRLHEQHLMVAEAESLAAAGHARLDALRATLV